MLKQTLLTLFLTISTLQAQSIVIRAGTLLDGKGGVLQDQDILVQDGRIARVSPAQGVPTYDLSSYTVMPGWIDTHVHLGGHFRADGGGRPAPRERVRESDRDRALYTAGNAYTTLMAGFTTVQSLARKNHKELEHGLARVA